MRARESLESLGTTLAFALVFAAIITFGVLVVELPKLFERKDES